MSPRSSEQFDLFAKPPRKSGGEVPPSLPEEPAGDESYEPTVADEQARLAMEHGPNVQYIPPKSRKEREAEERRRKAMLDDTLGRLGAPGHQLLTDEESPFAQGARLAPRSRASPSEAASEGRGEVGEEEERRKRKKK